MGQNMKQKYLFYYVISYMLENFYPKALSNGAKFIFRGNLLRLLESSCSIEVLYCIYFNFTVLNLYTIYSM